MQEMNDMALLREYTTRNSEAAFELLVSRRIHFVYSAALRQVRDPHLAQEITQAVFIILAQKAARISEKAILTGWLFKTTRYTTLAQMRAAAKRQRREQEAQMRSELQPTAPDPLWEQMSPMLDEALATLGEKDRQAVLLRFFENKSLAEVGNNLGTGEDTARKRVTRALEKLHRYFSKRGVSSTTAIIAGALAANSVQAAPVALAKSVTVLAITKGAAVSGSTLTLIKGALKLMAWTKAKTAIVVGGGLLLAAGTTTVTVSEIQEHTTYSWQLPENSLNAFYKSPPQIKIVPTKFSNQSGMAFADSTRGTMGIGIQAEGVVCAAYQQSRSRTIFATKMPPGKYDFFVKPSENDVVDVDWVSAFQREITKTFGVIGHFEKREVDVLLLKYNNPNAQGLKTANSLRRKLGVAEGTVPKPAPGELVIFKQHLDNLTGFLERRLLIPISDKTGLTDEYDLILKWDEPDHTHPNNDALKQSLLNQLGLELVPSRESIKMLVVEKVKQPK